jgi:ATP-dependent DNA helicase RecG
MAGMGLPINVHALLTGQTVESERIEYKEGWNPLDIVQTICGFANDINNWGGGYIVVGIKEVDGLPQLPPKGIQANQVDKMQKELLNLCNELRPAYYPITEAVEFQGKTIFFIWVPGGETRPYKAPDVLGEKPRTYSFYIRRFSSTKKASDQEVTELMKMSEHIPFDDQIQQKAEVTDIKLSLIRAHLAEIGSDLAGRIDEMPINDLLRRMNIVAGPDEYLKPKNIGLLLFNDNPTSFFPCAQIDLVEFKDDIGDKFTERIFNGPIQQQLRDALIYIKNNIVTELVKKQEGSAESIRYYNYPYAAIEEALVNTVYHRSYQDDSPIELRVYPDKFEMVSYPGPLPPLNREKLRSGKIVARKYRNRRIGDFLKELRLTEGRGTGIPKIIRAMQRNGSPEPIFDTDDELSYFTTTLPIHPEWNQAKKQDRDQDGDQDRVQDRDQDGDQDRTRADMKVLEHCLRPKKKREILTHIGLYNNYKNFRKYVKTLIDKGYLAYTLPDKPSSGNQQYKTTPEGEHILSGE